MRTSIALGLLLGLLFPLSACDGCGPSERDLWVVNNSGAPFSVAVDGKEVLPSIASATGESSAPDGHVKVKPGDRTIEARFADGTKVVRRVMFSQQTSGYVFAPRRDKASCFYAAGPQGETALDRNDEVLGLPHVLDDEHKLRMKPCGR
jgi:hypothetical protein